MAMATAGNDASSHTKGKKASQMAMVTANTHTNTNTVSSVKGKEASQPAIVAADSSAAGHAKVLSAAQLGAEIRRRHLLTKKEIEKASERAREQSAWHAAFLAHKRATRPVGWSTEPNTEARAEAEGRSQHTQILTRNPGIAVGGSGETDAPEAFTQLLHREQLYAQQHFMERLPSQQNAIGQSTAKYPALGNLWQQPNQPYNQYDHHADGQYRGQVNSLRNPSVTTSEFPFDECVNDSTKAGGGGRR